MFKKKNDPNTFVSGSFPKSQNDSMDTFGNLFLIHKT